MEKMVHTVSNDSHGGAHASKETGKNTLMVPLRKGDLPPSQHAWARGNINPGTKAEPRRTYYLTFMLCLQEVGSRIGIRVGL